MLYKILKFYLFIYDYQYMKLFNGNYFFYFNVEINICMIKKDVEKLFFIIQYL